MMTRNLAVAAPTGVVRAAPATTATCRDQSALASSTSLACTRHSPSTHASYQPRQEWRRCTFTCMIPRPGLEVSLRARSNPRKTQEH